MIFNQDALLQHAPIVDMLDHKATNQGVSHGLTEVGYDIRLRQDVWFWPPGYEHEISRSSVRPEAFAVDDRSVRRQGRFCLASAMEEFQMPPTLMAVVHDKSTWARRGLSVFNTVIEPGWRGFLTLELVFHGSEALHIPAGSGVAQVVFQEIMCPATYEGKYQDQADEPVEAKFTPN